jgi:DNA-binding NarL/FixJ family response regulator
VTTKRSTSGGGRRAARRRVVCVLSANPIALRELGRLLQEPGEFRVRRFHLDLSTKDPHEIRVPAAPVYVLDGWSTWSTMEAVVASVRQRHRAAMLLVVGGRISDPVLFSLLHLGVKGLVPCSHLDDHLAHAVRHVAQGGLWIPRAQLSRFLEQVIGQGRERQAVAATRNISRREREVLNCVLKNLSNKEIGSELHISESTVKFHLARLFEKFGVRRRADLILQTVQQPASLVH